MMDLNAAGRIPEPQVIWGELAVKWPAQENSFFYTPSHIRLLLFKKISKSKQLTILIDKFQFWRQKDFQKWTILFYGV